jgi:hypothetical protein
MEKVLSDEEFIQLVHKFRDEQAPVLTFKPCVEKLLDAEHCRQITGIMHQNGARWERRIATHDLHESLPKTRGIYMFVWRPCLTLRFDPPRDLDPVTLVLYVGKAGVVDGTHDTFKARYQNEYCRYVARDASVLWEETAEDSREARLGRYLTLRPLDYWFLEVEQIRDIALLEKQLIRMLRPPLNTQHGARFRLGKPEPAFNHTELT